MEGGRTQLDWIEFVSKENLTFLWKVNKMFAWKVLQNLWKDIVKDITIIVWEKLKQSGVCSRKVIELYSG